MEHTKTILDGRADGEKKSSRGKTWERGGLRYSISIVSVADCLCVCVVGRPAASKRAAWRLRVEWELLLWMIGSFAVLYFTNFASHLLFNPVVKRYRL